MRELSPCRGLGDGVGGGGVGVGGCRGGGGMRVWHVRVTTWPAVYTLPL